MSLNLNKIILAGRLVADPEQKQTQNGTAVTTFRLAVNRSYKREGEPEADFFHVTAFGKTAEFVAKYFRRGQEILVVGEMQSHEYTTREGAKATGWEVQVREVEFCGSKADNQSPAAAIGNPAASAYSATAASAPAYSAPNAPNFRQIGTDDDLPF